MLTVPFQKRGNKYYFTPKTQQQLYQLHYGLGLHYDNDIIPKQTYRGFYAQIVSGLPLQYEIEVTQRTKNNNPYTVYTCSEFTIYHYPKFNQLTCVLNEKQYQQHLLYLSSLNS